MLEFARQQWLWLFVLVAVFFVAWLLARRYRKQRVTYGRVWELVAKRVLPPGWKRILRTVLTLVISGVMLSSVVLYAAGLQRPKAEETAPLLIAIMIDNSPSMRAQQRQSDAHARAQEIVDSLGEYDRALIGWFRGGHPMLGAWVKQGDLIGDPPATDFAAPNFKELRDALLALEPPPDVPEVPAPLKFAFWLGDAPPDLPSADVPERVAPIGKLHDIGVPAFIETFGSAADNDAIIGLTITSPGSQDAHGGILEIETRGTEPPAVSIDGKVFVAGHRVELPGRAEEMQVEVAVSDEDAFSQDDVVRLNVKPRRLTTVALAYPATDKEPDIVLKEALEFLLPGREVVVVAADEDSAVKADLVVLDRVLPASVHARFLMCFGVLPSQYGRMLPGVEVEPNMQMRPELPRRLGLEVPDLSLIYGEPVVPLADGHEMVSLAEHLEGGALIGIKRGDPEMLYSGFIPHRSTVLQDSGGLLLVMRWLAMIQEQARTRMPQVAQAGAQTEFQLATPGEIELRLSPDNVWAPVYGARNYTVVTGADGRGRLGPFEIPGEYEVFRNGQRVGGLTAIWHDDAEQSLPYTDHSRVDLAALQNPGRETDWRDYLPGALLWIALFTLTIEWVLWLVGVAE